MDNDKSYAGLPNVQVTIKHVDRALRMIGSEAPNWADGLVNMEAVMIAAVVIANMDEFDNRMGVPSMLPMFVDEIMRSWDSGSTKIDEEPQCKPVGRNPKRSAMAKVANKPVRMVALGKTKTGNTHRLTA
jgi:hypothetical protein